uniref:Transcription initiation factor TFIID subunit 4B isoform X4 n=1 Tax=Geotrypetes seraphini TaxID=260995 RepID=A0A6P8PU93_GEOSA|nr:transcription initiation factor TFIID subunit 4B isoform X4 [Geotrypetes seraphini]
MGRLLVAARAGLSCKSSCSVVTCGGVKGSTGITTMALPSSTMTSSPLVTREKAVTHSTQAALAITPTFMIVNPSAMAASKTNDSASKLPASWRAATNMTPSALMASDKAAMPATIVTPTMLVDPCRAVTPATVITSSTLVAPASDVTLTVTPSTLVASARPAVPATVVASPTLVASARPATVVTPPTLVASARPAVPATVVAPPMLVASARPAVPATVVAPPTLVASARPAVPAIVVASPTLVASARPATVVTPPTLVASARPAVPTTVVASPTLVASARPATVVTTPTLVASARLAVPATVVASPTLVASARPATVVTTPTLVASARLAVPATVVAPPMLVASARPAVPATVVAPPTLVASARPAVPATVVAPPTLVASARPATVVAPPTLVASARPATVVAPPTLVASARPATVVAPPTLVASARPATVVAPPTLVASARAAPPATVVTPSMLVASARAATPATVVTPSMLVASARAATPATVVTPSMLIASARAATPATVVTPSMLIASARAATPATVVTPSMLVASARAAMPATVVTPSMLVASARAAMPATVVTPSMLVTPARAATPVTIVTPSMLVTPARAATPATVVTPMLVASSRTAAPATIVSSSTAVATTRAATSSALITPARTGMPATTVDPSTLAGPSRTLVPATLIAQGSTLPPKVISVKADGSTVAQRVQAASSTEILDNVKKCKSFLATLIKLACSGPQSQEMGQNVKNLVQNLLEGKIEPEEFTKKLYTELKSSPQPYLVPFLKKSVPSLRQLMPDSLSFIQQCLQQQPQTVGASTNSTCLVTPKPSLQPVKQSSGATPITLKLHQPCSVPIQPNSMPQAVKVKQLVIQQPAGVVGKQVVGLPPTTTLIVSKPGESRMLLNTIIQAKQFPAASILKQVTLPGNTVLSLGASPAEKNNIKENVTTSFRTKVFTCRDEDDINDVASMAGVNISEENAGILATHSEFVGRIIQSTVDEPFLFKAALQKKILDIGKRHNVVELSSEVVNLVSHATQERLRDIIEKLTVVAQHRCTIYKDSEKYLKSGDTRSQLKFLEQLDQLEKQRKNEEEREILLRVAKSRSNKEDPEQQRLKQKAKEMQQIELAQIQYRDANLAALAAIGPRRKRSLDSLSMPSGCEDASSVLPGSFVSGLTKTLARPRITRVCLRDLIFCMEQERKTKYSRTLYGALLK